MHLSSHARIIVVEAVYSELNDTQASTKDTVLPEVSFVQKPWLVDALLISVKAGRRVR